MPWPKRKAQQNGTMAWEQDVCPVSEVSKLLASRAANRWLTKHIVPLQDGTVLIVSMQSAAYAQKPAKKPKVAPKEPE